LNSQYIPCPVDQCYNVELVWFYEVNYAVGAFYDFANLFQIIFRYFSSRKREICYLLRSSGYSIHHTLSVFQRVKCNISVNGI